MQRPSVCSTSTDGEYAALVAMATAERRETASLVHLCEGGGDAEEKGVFATTRLLTCHQTQPPEVRADDAAAAPSARLDSAAAPPLSAQFPSNDGVLQKCACSLLSRVTPVSQGHFLLWLGFFQYGCNQNDLACEVGHLLPLIIIVVFTSPLLFFDKMTK